VLSLSCLVTSGSIIPRRVRKRGVVDVSMENDDLGMQS